MKRFLFYLLFITIGLSFGGTLTVQIYWDRNLNGYYDDNDIPLGNFPVSIYNASSGNYITTLYTDQQGKVKYNADGDLYVVANAGIYSYNSLWERPTLVGVYVNNGKAFCLGNGYKNYHGFCAGGYNPNAGDSQYINKNNFDISVNNYFVELNATQNAYASFGFSPFVVVNDNVDFNSEGNLCFAFKSAVDFLEKSKNEEEITIKFFSGCF